MSSVNKVILLGRAGKDPVITNTKDGKVIASFTLATNDFGKEGKAQWHNITLFEPQSTVAQSYVKKGNEVFVEGRISYEEWEKDGVKKNMTRIIGTSIQLLGSKKDNEGSGQDATAAPVAAAPAKTAPAKAATTKAKPAPVPEPASSVEDDDLPF